MKYKRRVSQIINVPAPASILLFGNIFFIAIYLLSPTTVYYPPSIESILFYLMSNIVLSIFMTLNFNFTPFHKKELIVYYNLNEVRKYLIIAIIIIVIGIIFRLIDRFYIRGLDLLMSSFERKQIIGDTETSLFSVASAFIYPSALFIYPIIRLFKIKSFRLRFISILLFGYPSIDVLLTGNRGMMVVSFSLFIFYFFIFRDYKNKISKIVLLVIVGLIAFILSLYIFIDRISSYGFTPFYTANYSVYAFTIKPIEFVNEILKDTGFKSTIVFAYTNFTQYYSHGFFEWGYLFDNFQEYSHTMGAYTFYLGAKFLGFFTGQSFMVDPGSIQPRSGVYTTFLGPIFIDFGFFSYWFLAFFGLLIYKIKHFIFTGKIFFIPIFAYLMVILFFFPVVNLVQNALGLFVISSFILFYIFLTKKMGNKILCKVQVQSIVKIKIFK